MQRERDDSAAPAGSLRARRERWLAAGLIALATVVLARDRVLPLDALPQPYGDQGQMVWNLWHTAESVLAGKDPYVTDRIFHPVGANLATHTLAAGFVPVTLLVKASVALAGAPPHLYPFVAYKVLISVSYWLLAFLSWLFFRRIGATPLQAAIPALGYAFSSFFHNHAIHLNHLAGFFIPLTALLAVRFFETPRKATAAALGLSAALSVYFTEFFLFLVLAAPVFVLALAATPEGRREIAKRRAALTIPNLTALALSFLVALAPFLAHWATSDALPPKPEEAAGYCANLIGFFFPSPRVTPLYARLLPDLDSRMVLGSGGWEVFVGFPLLLLGAVAWKSREPLVRAARWSSVVFFVLSLGTRLVVLRGETGVPMPYALLSRLPILQQNRTPVRFVSVALFFWAIVALAGLKRVSATAARRSPAAGLAATGFLLAWTAVECAGKGTLFVQPAATLEGLVPELPKGAVLNVPFENLGLHSAMQVFHGRPIATGYVARPSTKQIEQLQFLERALSDEPAALGAWLSKNGYGSAVLDRVVPFVYRRNLAVLPVALVELAGSGATRAAATFGEPKGVGDFPEKWTDADKLEGVRVYDVPGGVTAKQVDLLADDNDTYEIRLFSGGKSVAELRPDPVPGGGLRWRAAAVPAEAQGAKIDRVEVRPLSGDGIYAVRCLLLAD